MTLKIGLCKLSLRPKKLKLRSSKKEKIKSSMNYRTFKFREVIIMTTVIKIVMRLTGLELEYKS